MVFILHVTKLHIFYWKTNILLIIITSLNTRIEQLICQKCQNAAKILENNLDLFSDFAIVSHTFKRIIA